MTQTAEQDEVAFVAADLQLTNVAHS
ncbi:MAG: hypothetical protein JWM12_611, partial [Ilumatobacteraceae bacterium]|nr:hypothetical protein [Ilumatobacteraceae bacterium]